MEKLELVAAGGISPVRTDPDLVADGHVTVIFFFFFFLIFFIDTQTKPF